ncbi:MAG: rod shape-determining protein MreD [Actinobacteria bacterium]|nr:rod shape-determining protein MreD [Actinomycetota bacterium]MSZ03427.1 rod shape-determining protein MreD [Actinomycetota bacterium]MTB07498.1 rod shape-determining protein MreD [Actinomycetota bacterium]
MLYMLRRPWFRLGAVALVLLAIQTTLFAEMKPFGETVDLMVLASVATGVVGGSQFGALAGFIFGIAFDLVLVTPFGMSPLVYGLVGFLAGYTQSLTFQPTWYLHSAFVAAGSAVAVFGLAIVQQIIGPRAPLGSELVQTAMVVGIANGLIAPLALPVQRWCLGIKRVIA